MTIKANLVEVTANNIEQYAAVYKLSEPITLGNNTKTDYVWISSIDNVHLILEETFIFPCDKNGEVIDWYELEGSMEGKVTHEEVIKNAGWVLE